MTAVPAPHRRFPLVSIVILNWNGSEMTIECLKNIEATDYPNYQLILVDNGSKDDSVNRLQAASRSFEFIQTGINLGFTGGCNVGIAKALEQGADYVLLLNNDVKITSEMLSLLVDAATEADAAICGARVMDEAGKTILFDGEKWPWNLFGLKYRTKSQLLQTWSFTDRADGCVMLVRRDIMEKRLRESGHVLAPDYFMYCEETEFCRYTIANKLYCIVVHGAIAFHGLAKSSGGGGNPRSYYYLTRNRVFLANRWLSLSWRIIFHMYYVPSRLMLQFKRDKAVRSAVWQGLKDGYLGVRGIWNRHDE